MYVEPCSNNIYWMSVSF